MRERLEADIKAALIAGNKEKARALNFIKSSILQVEKDSGATLKDDEIITIFRKEIKKRTEAAELFTKGGNLESSAKEKSEIDLINVYLPEQLSREDTKTAVEAIVREHNLPLEQSSMGRIIGAAKTSIGANADPSVIAQVVSELIKGG